MKTALVDGIEVEADLTAPAEATCPTCGDPVALRVWQRGDDEIWYYLHDRGKGVNCPRRQGRAMQVDSGDQRGLKLPKPDVVLVKLFQGR